MGQYLIDSNIISGYFSNLLKQEALNFVAGVIDLVPNISVITQIESLSWVNADKNKELILQDFVKDSVIIPLTQEIVFKCISIRRSRKIKTPDAIIAATAIIHKLILITNDSHFLNIKDLTVILPNNL